MLFRDLGIENQRQPREHFCGITTLYSAKELQWWQVYLHYAHKYSDFHRPTVSGVSSCLCYCFLLMAQHPSPGPSIYWNRSREIPQLLPGVCWPASWTAATPLPCSWSTPRHNTIFTKRYSDSSYIQQPLFTLYFQIYISKIPRVVNNWFFFAFILLHCFLLWCHVGPQRWGWVRAADTDAAVCISVFYDLCVGVTYKHIHRQTVNMQAKQ